MEKAGLLSRHDSPSDKRQQIVFLTAKGHEMREKCASIPRCMVAALADGGIEAERVMEIMPVLDEVIEGLNQRIKPNQQKRKL